MKKELESIQLEPKPPVPVATSAIRHDSRPRLGSKKESAYSCDRLPGVVSVTDIRGRTRHVASRQDGRNMVLYRAPSVLFNHFDEGEGAISLLDFMEDLVELGGYYVPGGVVCSAPYSLGFDVRKGLRVQTSSGILPEVCREILEDLRRYVIVDGNYTGRSSMVF